MLVTAITLWVPRDQMGLNLAIGPVMAFTILMCATRSGPVLRQLGRPLGVYLGEISYGVYLWHALVIAYLMRSTSLTVHPTTTALIVVAVTLGLSSLSHHVIERPARAWITGRRRRTPSQGAAIGTAAAVAPSATSDRTFG